MYKAPLPVWQQHKVAGQQHTFLYWRISAPNSCLGDHKSQLCWCAATWLIWIDYQLISGMSFAKTVILWQQLNSSPVVLHYRVCSTQLSGWFSQLTWLPSLQFCSVYLRLLPFLLHPRGLSQSRSCCQPQQHWRWMNQCFHFSIITAMTINTGLLTVHAGCICDFLIAQVCKRTETEIDILEQRRMFCHFLCAWVTKHVGMLCHENCQICK